MPASILGELILRPLFEVVLSVFGYLTGRVIVPLFTLGVYSVETVLPSKRPRPRPRLRRRNSSPPPARVVEAETAALFGLLFWFGVLAAGYFIWQAVRT